MDFLPQVSPEFHMLPFHLWDTDEAVVNTIISSAKTQMIQGNICQALQFGAACLHVLRICNALPGKGQVTLYHLCFFPQHRKIIFDISRYLAVKYGLLPIPKLLKDLILSQQQKIIHLGLISVILNFMVLFILTNFLQHQVLTKPSTNIQ